MPKKLFIIFFSLFFLLIKVSPVKASLVTVNKEGEPIWNVLASEDQVGSNILKNDPKSLEVINSATEAQAGTLALKITDGKMYLNDLDVTNYQDNLVEIEERGNVKRINIGRIDNFFTIEQNGITAKTIYPIIIRPKENELSVTTSGGSIYVSILPIEAAETAIRSRFVSNLTGKDALELTEDNGILSYKISGEKVLNLLNVTSYKIPVVAHVSASTGELLAIDGPEWFKIFGFLFS